MDKKEIENLITQVIRQNDMRNRQGKNLQDVLMGILQYIYPILRVGKEVILILYPEVV
jgi:hypothetical protein